MRLYYLLTMLFGKTSGLLERVPLRSDIADVGVYAAQLQRDEAVGHQLTLKFDDVLRIRGSGGELFTAGQNATVAHRAAEVARSVGCTLEPLLGSMGQELEQLIDRAENRSGRAQPDLRGIYRCDFPAHQNSENLARLTGLTAAAHALAGVSGVEYVHIEPLGVPVPVVGATASCIRDPKHLRRSCNGVRSHNKSVSTPDFQPQQLYRGPASVGGFDADYAEGLGADVWPEGEGVRYADCEYGWTFDHEDNNDLHQERGHPQLGRCTAHGTAATSSTKGIRNGFGVTGVAVKSDAYTFSEQTVAGYNRARAVAAAAANSRVGDVVLLEMQTSCMGSNAYAPAECTASIFDIVKTATDAGVVVVGAAGNGNANLDSNTYREYRNRGDSGAIIVGAGTASAAHSKLSFSTYGARLDVQAWGELVMTAGYGDCSFPGGGEETRHYSRTFSGTSSASGLVAGVVTGLQSYVKKLRGTPLDSVQMRELLAATGVPQGSGGRIGPHVNLRNAIGELNRRFNE